MNIAYYYLKRFFLASYVKKYVLANLGIYNRQNAPQENNFKALLGDVLKFFSWFISRNL
jgi:hypothetical protein